MKKIVVAVLFLGGGYYFIKKILPMFSNKDGSGSYNSEQIDYEVPEFITVKKGGSIGLPKYKAPKNKEIPNREMYEPDRNRQGETLAGDSKNMCRQYGTCPPSLDRDLGFW
tara:strand:+ start:5366 stop:5698 length:333 start_codon:yes stop_codon:yes gene_type:complete